MASPNLRKLPLQPYHELVFDASQNAMKAEHLIRVNLVVGSPAVSVCIDMVVVENLPYSCLVGTDFTTRFNRWTVDHISSTLSLDSSCVQIYERPQYDDNVNLLTSCKTVLLPGETKVIKTIAKGPGTTAFRPFTENTIMTEGVQEREQRTSVRIFPSLNSLGKANVNTAFVRVTNTSHQVKTVGKGVKLARGHCDFNDIEFHSHGESVNLTSNIDVLDIVFNRNDVPHLSDAEYNEAKSVLAEFRDIMTISNEKIGKSNEHFFHVDENVSPVSVPLRRVPMHKETVMKDLIAKYKDLGLIEEIDSPFRAATVLVQKKNPSNSADITDQYRICVDYRVLNNVLPDSAWPAPAIDHCLDAAAGSLYLSSLDFNNGYYQIPCTDSAKYTLAFSPGVGFGQYTFTGMPPGVKPAASCFQQAMEKTFQGLEHCILPPYFDDVNIKGASFQEHLNNIRLCLTRVRKSGFTLNALKCRFFQIWLRYLGHILEKGNVTLDPERVRAITNIPVPGNVKALRSLIGMIQFCNRFIPNLNERISPLYNLLRKGVSYNWCNDCQAAFEYIKTVLSSPPVLRCPASSDYFVLETDASDTGVGACLKVENGEGEFVVAYHSGKLDDTQFRWHIVEKEAYAIVNSIEKYRHYLIGKRFTLKTDNRILSYLNTSKSKKLAKWALQLSEYTFDVIHIPSRHNAVSDFFSRLDEVNLITHFTPTLTVNDWRAAQQECMFIRCACDYVKCKQNFDVTSLGPLKRFRKFLTLDGNGILCWKTKIVVPEKLQIELLQSAHDHPTSGHFAEERTWKLITSNYFWPNLHNDVINYVRSCKACNEFDVKTYVKRPLQPIESGGRFELVCYDLAGPFIPSRVGKYVYVLILVDHFCKWPEIIPLQRADSPSIARAIFDQWCCRYGIMTQLHSDGAQNVHGEIVQELCKLIGTVKSKSSRLHPQGDGLSEAMVKIIKTAVKKQVDSYGLDWDLYLQPTAFAIRSSINSSTRYAPAELLMGENLMRPIDVTVNSTGKKSFSAMQAKEFATSLASKMDEANRIVQSNLQAAREKMKELYDRHNSSHKFVEGDTVMLWWPYFKKGISRAFQPKWKGPYRITRLIKGTNAVIIDTDGKTKNVHLNQLKPVEVRKADSTPLSRPSVDQLLDNILEEPDNVPVVEEQNEESEEDSWCGLSEHNIIDARTRSGR